MDAIHPELQRWAREQGWESFRPFQEEAARLILTTEHDVLISASTSAGKTEAAYLPLLTQAAGREKGVSVLCLSPTKALINDQVRRIQGAASRVGVPVYAWHGDAPASRKNKLLQDRRGIVVMTIESLEGRFVHAPNLMKDLFGSLDAVVIDEFHEFLGGARGAQLSCLLSRLDDGLQKAPRRVALSATIADQKLARHWLRPQDTRSVQVILGPEEPRTLRSRVRGYSKEDATSSTTSKIVVGHRSPIALREIERSIYERLRRGSHLVFAGSRSNVEDLADGLARRCERARVQSNFVCHHGSVAKHGRESVEERLRAGEELTVLTTTTLALGVDIGSIDSVEIIGAPLSVTAFRQMVGRSGRRQAPPTVDLHITERPIGGAGKIADRLRLSTVRTCAALNLLEKRAFEAIGDDGSALSVMVQQVLSIMKQYNGSNLPLLYRLIGSAAAFGFVTERQLRTLLEHLACPDQGLIEQVDAGRYILTEKGEKFVRRPEFYASFHATDQWVVVAIGSGEVGQISLSNPLKTGDTFRLNGGAWEVRHLDLRKYRVNVAPATTGQIPAFDFSMVSGTSEQLALEMRAVLESGEVPLDLDEVAASNLGEGRLSYKELGLAAHFLVADGDMCHVFSWRGTRFNSLLAVFLRCQGFSCTVGEVAVTISGARPELIAAALAQSWPDLDELSSQISSIAIGKHDRRVPAELLRQYWAQRQSELVEDVRAFCTELSAATVRDLRKASLMRDSLATVQN